MWIAVNVLFHGLRHDVEVVVLAEGGVVNGISQAVCVTDRKEANNIANREEPGDEGGRAVEVQGHVVENFVAIF